MKQLRNLAAVIGIAAIVSACVIIDRDDVEVTWTIDNLTDTSFCSTFGIDQWRVMIVPLAEPGAFSFRRVPCNGIWTTGTVFSGIRREIVDITVQALNATDNVIADRTVTLDLGADPTRFELVNVAFTSADFGGVGPGDGKINVFWNINGTTNGVATGPSWDTCAEVSADKVIITVDGNEQSFGCDQSGNMSVTIENLSLGDHTLGIKLQDASGTDLTTEASGMVQATAAGGEFVADFFYNAFNSTLTGDFILKSTYEGLACSATSPNVEGQASLINLNGTPINPPPDICYDDASSTCVVMDGATSYGCTDANQRIAGLEWGLYSIRLKGTINGGADLCWETAKSGTPGAIDILIGAGTDNPRVTIDLDRVSVSGQCAP